MIWKYKKGDKNEMNSEEIKEYLKENLKIEITSRSVTTSPDEPWFCEPSNYRKITTTIKLRLDGEVISESSTSESFRIKR